MGTRIAENCSKTWPRIGLSVRRTCTALASLTFKNIHTTYTGDLTDADDQAGFTTLFQPVLPFLLANGDNMGTFPIIS